jgi:hypothetical protein
MTTTKTYQAQLPLRNHRIVRPVPQPRPPVPPGVVEMEAIGEEIRQKLREKIDEILFCGSWFCNDCKRFCERIEGEQGQPAHCDKCGSHRITFLEPLKQKEGK